MKDIKDYLHLYLGCQCQRKMYYALDTTLLHSIIIFKLSGFDFNDWNRSPSINIGKVEDKLILRNLSDMRHYERLEMSTLSKEPVIDQFIENSSTYVQKWNVCAEQFQYLLSKYFDIFNLHEQDLCLYKSDLK